MAKPKTRIGYDGLTENFVKPGKRWDEKDN